ncbi:MAG: BatA domain-containing protein [Planctomycetes bacterium]|nr:BatA domain-containing protein [Planctomycetota bacterium]
MGRAASVVAAWSVGEPRALLALLLAIPLVVLHLHLKRRRRMRVASLRLVLEGLAPVDKSARFRRLRDRLALASRVAALARTRRAGGNRRRPVWSGARRCWWSTPARTTSAHQSTVAPAPPTRRLRWRAVALLLAPRS